MSRKLGASGTPLHRGVGFPVPCGDPAWAPPCCKGRNPQLVEGLTSCESEAKMTHACRLVRFGWFWLDFGFALGLDLASF